MKNIPTTINDIEFAVNGNIKVSSIQVAEKFKKPHKDVLKAIKNLECSYDFNRRNYSPIEYKDSRNRKQPAVLMSRDGLSYLVMGFTGKEAAWWKERFIEAFNKMELCIIAEKSRQKADDVAKLECRPMTRALKDTREDLGKGTKPFHYSNEHNMIYRVVLGVTKKKWCEAHDIDKSERFRDYMPAPMIEAIADMQRVNTDMIEMGLEYKERKIKLDKLYTKRHLQRCLAEIDNQEA